MLTSENRMSPSLNRRVGLMGVRRVVLNAASSMRRSEKFEELFGSDARGLMIGLLVKGLNGQPQAVHAQFQF